jgi:hypothetical protein
VNAALSSYVSGTYLGSSEYGQGWMRREVEAQQGH